MLKLDTRHVFSLEDEANLEFCLQIGVILPVGVDVPGKQEARRWFPQEDRTPVASAAIFAPFVPTAPDAWLDDRVHCVDFADLVVCQRPPSAHPFGEHAPCDRLWRLNHHDLAHAVRIAAGGPRLLRHRGFLSFLAALSAAFLNAASASSQNPSSQPRSASMPRESTAYIRRVPSARTTMSPAALRTFRCCETAGRLTSIPSAISLTERVPLRRRLNTRRRVGSPRASRARSTFGNIAVVSSAFGQQQVSSTPRSQMVSLH